MTTSTGDSGASKGAVSLKARIELLERELKAVVDMSVERRILLRLVPVLNQVLTRYVEEKIERAVSRDRIVQAFVPVFAQLNRGKKDDQDAHRVLTRLQEDLLASSETEDGRERLLDRLEMAQLKARQEPRLAGFLKRILAHHLVYDLFVRLDLTEAIEPDFLPDDL